MNDDRSGRLTSPLSFVQDTGGSAPQEALWLLIALLTPLFVNLWVEQQFEASKVWLLRALVWTLALVGLGNRLAGLRSRKLPKHVVRLVTALGLVLLLSTALNANRYIAVFGTLDRANGALTQASYLLLFLCIATQLDSEGSRRLLHTLILTALPICLLGLAQAVGLQPLPVLTDGRSLLVTTLGRANFTGAYLALLLPLTLTAAYSSRDAWQSRGYWMLVMLELVVIALTQARAAWIAAAVGVSVFFWLQGTSRWSRRDRWLSALIGVGGSAGTLVLILQRGIANGGSIAARWTIWRAALRLLWPRLWLGYGADTLELHFPSVYPPQLLYYQGRGVVVDRAHNWVLDWSLNYGVVATFFFAGIIFFILRAAWRRLTLSEHDSTLSSSAQCLEVHWVAACVASIFAHLVGNLFLFDVAATAVLFWMLLAILTAGTGNSALATSRRPAPRRLRRGVMVAGSLLLAWAVWQGSVRPLLADARSWRGTRALGRGESPAALADYAAAVEQQPRRAEYHVALALTAAQLGNFEQAHRAMGEAIALRPTDPLLYTHLAAIYAGEFPERLELAYAAYDRAIALAPTIALTYRHYADLALRSGDGAIALMQAQRAVGLDATDGIAFGILGWAQLQTGNPGAAQDAFEQAVTWEPASADFLLGLATAYFQQGESVAAYQALQRSLMIDPTYGPTLALQSQMGAE